MNNRANQAELRQWVLSMTAHRVRCNEKECCPYQQHDRIIQNVRSLMMTPFTYAAAEMRAIFLTGLTLARYSELHSAFSSFCRSRP